MSNMDKMRITVLSNELNNKCQVLMFKTPVTIKLKTNMMVIPMIKIGRVEFYAKNWALTTDQKLVKLLERVLGCLNDTNFCKANQVDLSGDQIIFNNMWSEDDDNILMRIDYIDESKFTVRTDDITYVLTPNS